MINIIIVQYHYSNEQYVPVGMTQKCIFFTEENFPYDSLFKYFIFTS